jgi:hypothetical protein
MKRTFRAKQAFPEAFPLFHCSCTGLAVKTLAKLDLYASATSTTFGMRELRASIVKRDAFAASVGLCGAFPTSQYSVLRALSKPCLKHCCPKFWQ